MLGHIPLSHDADLIDLPHCAKLRAALFPVAFALTRNRADADDVVQIALMRAVERASSLPGVRWQAWLLTVVRNLSLDVCRKKARTGKVVWELPDLPCPQSEPAPDWATLSLEHIDAALSGCNRIYRDVFVLHYVDGLRYEDIAERLGLPLGTVSTRLHRAKLALRRELERMLNAA